MSISAALHAMVGTLRRRPAELLSIYALGAAVPAIARVPVFGGLGAIVVYLQGTGRLGPLIADLSRRDLQPPDPETEPEAFSAWVEGLQPALEPLVSPVVVGVLVVSLVLAVLFALVLASAVSAAQLGACHARLRNRRGTTAAIGALHRHWVTFLGAFLLEGLIWAVALLVAVTSVGVAFALAPLVGVVFGALVLPVVLAIVVVTRAVFAFVPVTVVVDDVGLRRSIMGAGSYIRRESVGAVGYYAISVGVLLAVSTVAAVLSLVRANGVIAPLAILVIAPALDLVKTGLYAGTCHGLVPPEGPVDTLSAQLSIGARRGLRRLGGFVRATPGLHVLAIGLLVGGFVSGWVGATPFVGAIEASIIDRLAEHVPPAAALNYIGNNVTVSISMAYSGVALAVPAGLTLWFNGLLLGVLGRLEVAPAVLAAFVAPHGLFELPALIVSGALGLRLGVVGTRTWLGRGSRADLADALEEAFWVLVGVGVLLVVAGLVEGFVSPYYWQLLL